MYVISELKDFQSTHVCAQSCPTLCDPMGGSPPGSSCSWGFPRQDYWSGLPYRSPGDHLDPGIELTSLTSPALAGRFFTTSATWEAQDFKERKVIHRTEGEEQVLGN